MKKTIVVATLLVNMVAVSGTDFEERISVSGKR